MLKNFITAKILFSLLAFLTGFLFLLSSFTFAAELNCAIDMKAPPGSPSYLSWGAWLGPTDTQITRNDFKLNLACTAESVPESSITCWSPKIGGWVVVSSLCVGWDDTGTCDTSEPGNYSWSTPYPNDRTWNTPPSGTSRCISAWIRSRICDPDFVDNDGTKPGYRCVDSTSTHRTQTPSLWDGHFTIADNKYTYWENAGNTWTIRYWFALSGGVKQGEPVEIRGSDGTGFCGTSISAGGPTGFEFTCDKTMPIGTAIGPYTTNLYVWVADSRKNGPTSPPPAPISCASTITPSSQDVVSGFAQNFTGKVDSVSGGSGGYNYRWNTSACRLNPTPPTPGLTDTTATFEAKTQAGENCPVGTTANVRIQAKSTSDPDTAYATCSGGATANVIAGSISCNAISVQQTAGYPTNHIPSGGTSTLSVSCQGANSYSYSWSMSNCVSTPDNSCSNAGTLGSQSNNQINFTAGNKGSETDITVLVAGDNGGTSTKTVRLSVPVVYTVNVVPSNEVVINKGDSATFSFTVTCDGRSALGVEGATTTACWVQGRSIYHSIGCNQASCGSLGSVSPSGDTQIFVSGTDYAHGPAPGSYTFTAPTTITLPQSEYIATLFRANAPVNTILGANGGPAVGYGYVRVVPFSCSIAPAPMLVHPGETTTLNLTNDGGTSPYTYIWANPDCGYLSAPDVEDPNWTAKTSGGALIGGVTCRSEVTVTDSQSLQASCNVDVPVADFNLTIAPTSTQTICQGNEVSYTVTATATNGWNKPITLSARNCPTNTTCGFGAGRTSTYTITPTSGGVTVNFYIDTSKSTTCNSTTYSGIAIRGEVTNGSDPSYGWYKDTSTFSVTCNVCNFSCSVSPSSVTLYPGETRGLTTNFNPTSPPSGAGSYTCSSWATPNCGRFNPAPGSGSCSSTWEAKTSGGALFGGGSCGVGVKGEDPDSTLPLQDCNQSTLTVRDFSLSVSPATRTVNQGQTASYTVSATANNGWAKPVDLTISSIKNSSNQDVDCNTIATNCPSLFSPSTVTPSNPASTSTLSFNIKNNAPFDTYTIITRGTVTTSGDPSYGFYRDSSSFTLTISEVACSISPVSATVYPGESQALTANGGNTADYNYSWTVACGRFLNDSGSPTLDPGNDPTVSWQALNAAAAGSFIAGITCSPAVTCQSKATGGTAQASSDMTVRDFSLSMTPSSRSITAGGSTTYTVTATAVDGWNKSVTLSLRDSGGNVACPGSSCSFSPTTLFAGSGTTSTLTISGAVEGSYALMVRGEVTTGGDPSFGFYRDSNQTSLIVGCQSPDLPTSLSVDSVATNSASVSWSAPTSGPTPSRYGIQWAVSTSAYGASITETSSTSYLITGLTPNTTYKWHVRSQIDNCGNSDWVEGFTFDTSALFTCYVDPASGTVAPGETINSVTTKGSSSLIVTSWAAPSCGVLNASAPTNPVTWTAKNALGADLPDGSVCNINSNADTNPAGQSASCTKATYTVSAPQYCCDSVLNACCVPGSPTCSCPGGQPTSNCAGKLEGAWCGTGGASYDFSCSGITPRNCSVSTDGGTCTFSATAGSHGYPFVYRFGVSPNTTSREETSLTQWEANGYYNILPGDYSANNAISFKIASEKYLDRVEVILKALAAADPQPPAPTPTTPPRYIGSKVWAAIYNPSGAIVAEAMSNIPDGNPLTRDPGWGTVTFDFKVEPLVRANQFYKLNIRSYGKFETREGWEKFQYNGPLTKKFWFRDVPSSGGVGTFANGDFKTGDICYGQGTCSVVYTPPDSSSLASFNIGAEVSSSDDVCYNCGGNTCGCQQGKFTAGCAVLGTATVTADAWWQGGTGGDIYGLAGVSSAIPAAPTPYLIGGVPGIAMSGTSQLDTNGRDISQTKNWRVTNYVPKGLDSQSSQDAKGYSYNYFYNKLKDKVTQTFTDASDPKLNNILPNLGGSPPAIVLVDTGTSVTVKAEGEYNKGTAIVLINGNLNITKDVTVDGSSALMFIVNGDITMDPTLVTKIEGIYFAQRAFSTGSSNKRIIGNGAWYVAADPDPLRPDSNRKFNFGRDLGASNTSTPAEQVNFQPKYLLKLMDILGEPNYIWQEVAG